MRGDRASSTWVQVIQCGESPAVLVRVVAVQNVAAWAPFAALYPHPAIQRKTSGLAQTGRKLERITNLQTPFWKRYRDSKT